MKTRAEFYSKVAELRKKHETSNRLNPSYHDFPWEELAKWLGIPPPRKRLVAWLSTGFCSPEVHVKYLPEGVTPPPTVSTEYVRASWLDEPDMSP